MLLVVSIVSDVSEVSLSRLPSWPFILGGVGGESKKSKPVNISLVLISDGYVLSLR